LKLSINNTLVNCVLLLGALFIAPFAFAGSDAKVAACAQCIGDICLRPKLMSDTDLVKQYGTGYEKEDVIEKSVIGKRCYFDEKQGLWVLVDLYHNNDPPNMYVVGVHVSTQPLCKNAVHPKKPFPKLSLKTRLSVGDSESSALLKCGKPNRVEDAVAREKGDQRYKDIPGFGQRFGRRSLVYFPEGENSLLMLKIQITDGRVISLWLNESP
jgi:hypothetical protein